MKGGRRGKRWRRGGKEDVGKREGGRETDRERRRERLEVG